MSSVEQVVLEVRSSIGIVGEANAVDSVQAHQEVRGSLASVIVALGEVAGILGVTAGVIQAQLGDSALTLNKAADGADSLRDTLDGSTNDNAGAAIMSADIMRKTAEKQVAGTGAAVAKMQELRAALATVGELATDLYGMHHQVLSNADTVLAAQRATINYGNAYIEQIAGQPGAAE
ncbi:MAG TPA: hypothetical protein VLH86_00640 [Patescibacteria group bacterium]|nr:hypothetical protein [Patescibacteria group bacterium]